MWILWLVVALVATLVAAIAAWEIYCCFRKPDTSDLRELKNSAENAVVKEWKQDIDLVAKDIENYKDKWRKEL